MAQATGCSRRQADALIVEGGVQINGRLAVLGDMVRPSDNINLDGQPLRPTSAQTILLHKPIGYVCSRAGQGSRTVYDLLPPGLHHLKPVGRLDKDSSGLLLLTNDGSLAQELTHPSFEKEKVYEVELDEGLTPADFEIITTRGVQLDDGSSTLQLNCINDDTSRWRITMREGRNRQIRRTFAAVGYKVTRLHRTQFGRYHLDKVRTGQWQKAD